MGVGFVRGSWVSIWKRLWIMSLWQWILIGLQFEPVINVGVSLMNQQGSDYILIFYSSVSEVLDSTFSKMEKYKKNLY